MATLTRFFEISRIITRFLSWVIISRLPVQQRGPSLPERLPKVLEELGPTFIKFGQGLSLRRDLLPDKYIEALQELQDRVRSKKSFEWRKGFIIWMILYMLTFTAISIYSQILQK